LRSGSPANQEIWYLLGKVHMKLSEQALLKLNEIDRNSVWAHEISGEVMESMKNYDGALIEYKKRWRWLRNRPHSLSARKCVLGLNMWSAGDGTVPGGTLQRSCELHGRVETRKYHSGATRRSSRGTGECPKGSGHLSNLMSARVDRARSLVRLDRPAEAVSDLELRKRPIRREPSTHFLLAQTYRALGKTEEAQTEMKRFSELEESARAAKAERAKQVLEEKNKEQP